MNRSSVVSSVALVSAAAFSAAVLLRRLLRHGAVGQAVRADTAGAPVSGALPGWRESLPVTPVPPDTVAATTESAEAVPDGRPARTWVVDNRSDWDGSQRELVVPPGTTTTGSPPGRDGNGRNEPGNHRSADSRDGA